MKKTTEQFRKELEEINPTLELLSEYVGSVKKVRVRCKVCHNEYESTACNLLRGSKCSYCHVIKMTKKHYQFVDELKLVMPTITVKGKYTNSKIPLKVKCGKCNYVWKATPTHLLEKHGCPRCAGNIRKTTEQFMDEVKKINPNVEILSSYVNNRTKVKVRCKICDNHYECTPTNLLAGYGCKQCYYNRLRGK